MLLLTILLSFTASSLGLSVFPYLEAEKYQSTFVSSTSNPTHEGWRDPRLGGGSMIDRATRHKGEPINVIISGRSDPRIMSEDGLRRYSRSLGYNDECLNQHRGGAQSANLGDGLGYHDQQAIFRQHYFPIFGSCWESLAGGQHFRAWKQNGTEANTGAWFIAASQEMQLRDKHMIVEDGYNRGRDWFVEKAVQGTFWQGMWWKADVEWRTGLLKPGSDGINHDIPQDGVVAILLVHRV